MIVNNDTNIYVGDTEIVKVCQGNEIIYKKSASITSLGISDGQYIETNIVPDATTKVEMKIKVTPRVNPSGTNNLKWCQVFFGSRIYYTQSEFDFWVDYAGPYWKNRSGSGSIIYGCGSTCNVNALSTYPGWDKDCIVRMRYGGFSLEIDGVETDYPMTTGGGISSTTNTLWLFNMNCPRDPQQSWVNGDWYYTKIWKNNELVRDFVPALDDNDVPCMYDNVSQTYFYNQGTGQFSYK